MPGATILQIADDGAVPATDYDRTLPVRPTRDFLRAPDRLRHLLPVDDPTSTRAH